MKAAVYYQHGPAEVLKVADVPIPQITSTDEVWAEKLFLLNFFASFFLKKKTVDCTSEEDVITSVNTRQCRS